MDDSTSFWRQLDDLKHKLTENERIQSLRKRLNVETFEKVNTNLSREDERVCIIRQIEACIEQVLLDISRGEAPCLSYDSRNTWGNISFQEDVGLEMRSGSSCTSVKFDAIQSVRKFALSMKLLAMIHNLLLTNTFSTKRDLYYQDTMVFGSQSTLDDIIDNLSCMLKVPRWKLHISATSKGCVAGDLQYNEADGNYVDCNLSATGVMVPNHVDGISKSRAKFVLIVEKDATFQRLLDSGICRKLAPCIIVTGKGFPDLNTRLLVRKLWDAFHLPSLALVDADPHGMEIMCIYKFGSRSLSFEAPNLTVPSVTWLGVLPTDIDRLHIARDVLIPLTKADIDKASEIMNRPYFLSQPAWNTELQTMLKMGMKAEIQSLCSISTNFLTDVYLPNKIRYGGWI